MGWLPVTVLSFVLIVNCQFSSFITCAYGDGMSGLTDTKPSLPPTTCNQYFMNKSADCKSRNLEMVPDNLQAYIQILDLSFNRIGFLFNHTFRPYVTIIELYITFNTLLLIETEAFYPLKLLRILDLSENKNLHLPSGNVFKCSGNLRLLKLTGCKLTSIPDDILQLLPRLQLVDSEENAIKAINFTSCGRRANLSVNLYENKFQNITKDTVVFNCQSDYLAIGGPIRIIDADVIASLATRHLKLKLLAKKPEPWRQLFKGISQSSITEIEVFSSLTIPSLPKDIFYCMNNKSVSTLKIAIISLSRLSAGIFSNLTRVTTFVLTTTGIKIIKPEYFGGMNELRVLSLRANQISSINPFNSTWKLDLVELDLQFNKLDTFDSSHALHGLVNLTNLNLANNGGLYFLKISNLPNLRSLDISNTKLSSLILHTPLLASFWYVNAQESVEVLKMQGMFANAQSLEHIDMGSSKLQNLWNHEGNLSMFQGLRKLTTLYLKSNPLDQLKFRVFLDQTSLSVLDMQGCGLASIDPDSFMGLQNIDTLRLQKNELQFLHEKLFTGMRHLTNLHLDENKLIFLGDKLFIDTPNLRNLTLSNNLLADLNYTTFSRINRSALKSIDISNNPIVCNCEIKWLPELLVGPVVVLNENKTICSSASLEPLREKSIMFFKPNEQCVQNISLYFTIPFLTIVLCIAIAMVYRNRWGLRYKLFLLKLATVGYNEIQDARDHNDYEFDLNVMFADANEEWVRANLRPELEERLQHYNRNAYGDDDLIIGMYYLDAVLHLVENSYKTILLLSRAAVHDNWFMMKFRIALDYVNDVQTENVLVVFLEDIPDAELPFLVRVYLNDGRPHLHWVDDEMCQEDFWTELTDKLAVNLRRTHLIPHE